MRPDVFSTQADRQRWFARVEHVRARREEDAPVILPSAGVGGMVFHDNPGAGADYPGTGTVFDPALIDPPPVEVRSNLAETEVMLGKGSNVVGAGGHKVGTVDEVFAGDRDGIDAFLVWAGFLFKHDVRIPIAWVAEVDDERVRLNVTADEAERRAWAE